jgi:hypothetical protein
MTFSNVYYTNVKKYETKMLQTCFMDGLFKCVIHQCKKYETKLYVCSQDMFPMTLGCPRPKDKIIWGLGQDIEMVCNLSGHPNQGNFFGEA